MNEVAVAEAFPRFNYEQLPTELAAEAKRIADRVRSNHQMQAEIIIEVGRDLLLAKEKLGHGHFGPWLQMEVRFSERAARNYMTVAEAFDGKTATVADLAPTTLYALANAPAETRKNVVQRLEAGEHLADAEIRLGIADARRTEKEEQRDAQRTPEERKRREAAKKRHEREISKNRAEWEESDRRRREALDHAAEMIVDRLGNELPELLQALREGWSTELACAIEKQISLKVAA